MVGGWVGALTFKLVARSLCGLVQAAVDKLGPGQHAIAVDAAVGLLDTHDVDVVEEVHGVVKVEAGSVLDVVMRVRPARVCVTQVRDVASVRLRRGMLARRLNAWICGSMRGCKGR